ncbi:MAG: hypothetical protein JWQ30_1557 [Sediminibacterium sp.]|nr:hypothetical protein [Sediminibacterium sp.]
MRKLFSILAISWLFFACSKDGNSGKIEVYAVTANNFTAGVCKVDPDSTVLASTPLFDDGDIVLYNSTTCDFILKSNAAQLFNAQAPRSVFAVTLNKKVIYYFVHMPTFMSSSCYQSITANVLTTINKMYVRLGYASPSSMQALIKDERNNAELLAALSAQGKLQ